MSIPLDNLYNFIEDVAENFRNDSVIIYHFYPHGSKNLRDLQQTKTHSHMPTYFYSINPWIICADQEPLDFMHFANQTYYSLTELKDLYIKNSIKFTQNIYSTIEDNFYIYDKVILIHSEKRSENVSQYSMNRYIPVYYWSHAIISKDWFRYAQHITQTKQVEKIFLIYNRAWGGSREYRIKFADLIIEENLEKFCRTWFNPVCQEQKVHYTKHQFLNSSWKPNNILENYFAISPAQSHESARFEIKDYEKTDIEIVLETLFDDSRWHLTEKILRPIACGQPFILAATHESLEYLRSYGFKTFDSVWDEGYDKVKDPHQRLICISKLMKDISSWTTETKKRKMEQANRIACYNKEHFFSETFFNLVINELKENLQQALTDLENNNTSKYFFESRKTVAKYPELKKWVLEAHNQTEIKLPRQDVVHILLKAKEYYQKHTALYKK